MTSSLIARRLERAPNFCVRTWGLRAAATTLSPRSNASLTNRAPNPRDAPVINQVFIRYSFEFFLSPVREGEASPRPPSRLRTLLLQEEGQHGTVTLNAQPSRYSRLCSRGSP